MPNLQIYMDSFLNNQKQKLTIKASTCHIQTSQDIKPKALISMNHQAEWEEIIE
jgi:hypothetical protein